jgi:hypothetical protein
MLELNSIELDELPQKIANVAIRLLLVDQNLIAAKRDLAYENFMIDAQILEDGTLTNDKKRDQRRQVLKDSTSAYSVLQELIERCQIDKREREIELEFYRNSLAVKLFKI